MRGWKGEPRRHALAARGIESRQMLAEHRGYRCGGYGKAHLGSMLETEVMDFGNKHIAYELAEKLGMDISGKRITPRLLHQLTREAWKQWGYGGAIWLATKEDAEELYGRDGELEVVEIPENAIIIIDMPDGTLFYFPEEARRS